jgi:hypothetical protein
MMAGFWLEQVLEILLGAYFTSRCNPLQENQQRNKEWKAVDDVTPRKRTSHTTVCEYTRCGDVNLHNFTCSIQNHDSLVLRNSSTHLMLSVVYINGDVEQSALTVTDKAYGKTPHFYLHHTEAERWKMAPTACCRGV